MPKSHPSEADVKKAITTIIKWIGDDPSREGLKDTPARVLRSYYELFSGYTQDASKILGKTFTEPQKFDDIILLRDIEFTSFCEHHLLQFSGRVDVAYIPNKHIVGISKIARLVDMYAKRLQLQERMTLQIAESMHQHLKPKGVAVCVSASHSCLASRGIGKSSSCMKTYSTFGVFKTDVNWYNRFINMM